MTPMGRSSDAPPAFAGTDERPSCPRCHGYLRNGHTDDPDGLCEPCRNLVESCIPFAGGGTPAPEAVAGPAPAEANVLELAAGILLIHDALHRGEPLYLREALAAYGVEVDHVQAHKLVNKLRRRHGMVIRGESRQAGYTLEDWTYEAKRVRSSLAGG
jgi:hypothetical protein